MDVDSFHFAGGTAVALYTINESWVHDSLIAMLSNMRPAGIGMIFQILFNRLRTGKHLVVVVIIIIIIIIICDARGQNPSLVAS